MKVMLKTRCGCKQLLKQSEVVTPVPGSYYTRTLMNQGHWNMYKPGDIILYRTFAFKEINKKGVAIYEET